jgi:hypothetical protein
MATIVGEGRPQNTPSPDPECTTIVHGLDTTLARISRSTFLGDAVGQTFFAEDTILTKLTVWRWPFQTTIGVHLFITAVDTNRVPPRPMTDSILLDGPTLTINTPPPALIELPFVIDPPLVLPRRGLYAFFLQNEGCYGAAAWEIMGSADNPYPHGIYWQTGIVKPNCYLRAVVGGEDSTDLIFRAEFCRPASTPVVRDTWGHLKARYR